MHWIRLWSGVKALLSLRDSINQKTTVITFISPSAQGSVPLRWFPSHHLSTSNIANSQHTVQAPNPIQGPWRWMKMTAFCSTENAWVRAGSEQKRESRERRKVMDREMVNEDERKRREQNHITANQGKALLRIKLLLALRSISRLKLDLCCSTVWSWSILQKFRRTVALVCLSLRVLWTVCSPVSMNPYLCLCGFVYLQCSGFIFSEACTLWCLCMWMDSPPWKSFQGQTGRNGIKRESNIKSAFCRGCYWLGVAVPQAAAFQ